MRLCDFVFCYENVMFKISVCVCVCVCVCGSNYFSLLPLFPPSFLLLYHSPLLSLFSLLLSSLSFPSSNLSLTLLSSATIQTLLSAPYLLPLSLPAHVRYPLPFNQIPFPASLDIGSSSFSSNTAILKLFFPRFTTN